VSPEQNWVEFDAPLEPLTWGRNVYTIIRLHEELVSAAEGVRTRRVEGLLDEVFVNAGLNRADVLPAAFMYAGKPLLRRLAARPGDVVHCRLRPADPDDVPLAEDVHRALTDADCLAVFERKSPAQRRRLLQPIEAVARDATRQRRITALLRSLMPH
jgi:hypothetical protein